MTQKRRQFLYQAGMGLLAPVVGQSLLSCIGKKSESSTLADSTSIASANGLGDFDKFGLQLWSVKEDMAKDPKGTLKALSTYGYNQIESFGGEKGIFWGMTPADFKKYNEDLGMTVVGSHCNPAYTTDTKKADEFKKLAEDSASIGLKYLINPFPGEIFDIDSYKKVAEGLNKQGELLKTMGMQMGFHNHHIEFIANKDKSVGEQVLLDNTDPALVMFQLDLYWIAFAGGDPYEWFKKYNNRFKAVHVKQIYNQAKIDEIRAKEKPEGFWPIEVSTTLDNGSLDFSKILNAAKTAGVEYFIVEQERFDGSTPLADVAKDAEFMKKLKLS